MKQKQKRETKRNALLRVLTSPDDPDGWVSQNYLMREVWPKLWRDDPVKCRRNLSSQLSYLRRDGIVTETRSDPWDDRFVHRYIRLAGWGSNTGGTDESG